MRVFVAVFLLALGCGTLSQGQEHVLKPSQVSASFKELDDAKDNPFAKGPTKVEVMKVGIPNYDSFFQETAEVKGTVVLADVVLKETDGYISNLKKEIGAKKILTPIQAKELKQEQGRIGALVKLLGDVPDRSSKLLSASEGLTNNAAKTFIGPNAMKLPGVVKGISQSAGELKDAAAKAPNILKHAEKTTESLGSLAP